MLAQINFFERCEYHQGSVMKYAVRRPHGPPVITCLYSAEYQQILPIWIQDRVITV